MSELVILVPVLGRPQNVGPLLDSIQAATPGARTLFICDWGDAEEIAAVEFDPRSDLDIASGNYAAKINRGIRLTIEPLIFLGADDLHFHPGWFEATKAKLGEADVIGTQDLCNQRTIRGEHATHFLVTREYATRGQFDGSPGLLCEDYAHNAVDDELLGTATKRNAYAFADDAIVEHHHPYNGTAPSDATYEKGSASIRADRKLFRQRRLLWR